MKGRRRYVHGWHTIILLGATMTPWCADALIELRPLWVTEAATFTEAGPTVADINDDGVCEVITAGREEIIAVGAGGKILWRTKGHVRFMTVPTVLPRPGQPALIYAADVGGFMMCVDGTGKIVWDVKLNGPATWSVAALATLEGAPVVVQGDETGTIWTFDAITGKAVGTGKVGGKPSSPAVGDIDKDGRPEVVVVTDLGNVSAVDHTGATLWETNIGGTSQTWGTSAPVIFNASTGQIRIAAGSNDSQVACLDARGNILWRHAVRGPVAATLSVGDFDKNGRADIFLITQVGMVYRFDEDGAMMWEMDMQGRTLAAGSIIDLDNDGAFEYVFSTQDGHLQALDQAGAFVLDYQFKHRTINVTPAFGEIDPQSPGLEMAITGGEAGLIYVFATAAPLNAASPWNAYRGNAEKNGAWFGLTQSKSVRMTPANLSSDELYANEPVRFDIVVPEPGTAPLKAAAKCVRPDESRQSAVSRVVGGKGVLELPVNASLPGYYSFNWTLLDAENKTLLEGSKTVSIQPFANDRALTETTLETLDQTAKEIASALPRSSAALRNEKEAITELFAKVKTAQEAAASGPQEEARALDKTAALNERARHARAAAQAITQARSLGEGASLVAFEMGLWDSRRVDAQTPQGACNPVAIKRRLTRGEQESLSLGLFNILDAPLQARVLVEPNAQGPKVTLLRSVEVPTSQGDRSWDPLPELDESGVLTIPPLATAEVFVSIDTAGLNAGDHNVSVKVQAITGAGVFDGPKSPQNVAPGETVIEVALKILPFEMAPPGAVRLCAWARYDKGAIGDLLAHGNNVFMAPNGVPQYDAAGGLTDVDFTDLDARIELLRGNDVVVLLNGLPNIPGDLGSSEYERKFGPFVKATVAHMAEKSFDTDHFAFYPIDEPGGYGWAHINLMVAFGKMLRAANPKAMLYVDGGGELAMFEAMAPYIDIWCPANSMLAESSQTMDVVRHSGKRLWSYDCGYGYSRPVGPNIKNTNIPAQFLAAPLYTFRHGATGLGYWCYNLGDSLWARTQFEYPLVYPGRTKPVTSRRWEAVREGVEDFRILTALRERLQDGKLDAAVRERIRTLLEVRLPALIDKSFEEARLGLARYVFDASMNETIYNAFRNEMLDCAEAAGK
jgi:hypothetical protein